MNFIKALISKFTAKRRRQVDAIVRRVFIEKYCSYKCPYLYYEFEYSKISLLKCKLYNKQIKCNEKEQMLRVDKCLSA